MLSDLEDKYLESLTKREMEVLRLLETSASNQEIADTLVVEISTVKWYNSQIYEKLQVKNRKQAIIRARTLGILASNPHDPVLRLQHNLPSDTLPFIGREQEIKELIQQLTNDAARLITILGIGGMGKTRLSIELGRRLLAHFRDGVYFLSLAPVTATEQIVTTLAEVIGFKFHSDNQPRQQLLEHLQSQHLLLIIDNFEHLLGSTELLNDILQSAPKIKVLVTSREKLNLAGEAVHLLNGLSLPIATLKQVTSDYDAVKLFMASAQRKNVSIDNREISVIARICQLLGGMPLAILLASAWLDTLSVPEIEAEIKVGLSILEANLRDSPVRHHSIQAAFDASWKRLSPQEQAVFMRLSVFRDGFTREAAQTVTGSSIRDLQRLVHTSFVQLMPSGRYNIHELMRQYGEAKLQASDETRAVQEKHAQYFAEFITPLGEVTWGLSTHEMLEKVNADYENIRAAWLFQVEQNNIAELRRFLDSLWVFFDEHSRSQEGIALLEPLLTNFQDENDDETLFRGQLMARLSWFYGDIGQHQKALELAEQSLQIVEAFNATNDILLVYEHLFNLLPRLNRENLAYAEKGFELAQKNPDSKWLILFRASLGQSYLDQGRYEEARNIIQALPECRWQDDLISNLFLETGEYAQAEAVLLDSLNKYPFHRIGYMFLYSGLAKCAIQIGNNTKAWAYIQKGLQYGDDSGYAWGTLNLLSSVLELLIAEEQYSIATEFLSLIQHHPATIEWAKTLTSERTEDLKARLSDNEFEVAWERGKQLDLGDVITDLMER